MFCGHICINFPFSVLSGTINVYRAGLEIKNSIFIGLDYKYKTQ